MSDSFSFVRKNEEIKFRFDDESNRWDSQFNFLGSDIYCSIGKDDIPFVSEKGFASFLGFIEGKTLEYFFSRGLTVLESLAKVFFKDLYFTFNFELTNIHYKGGFEFELGYYLSFDNDADNDGIWFLIFEGLNLIGVYRKQY